MENKLLISFHDVEPKFELDIQQPDLAKLVHFLVDNNISITKENTTIETKNESFDTEEFLDILISVHEEFKDEIETFYQNIESEINTYYDDEELSKEIIENLKSDT